MCKHKECLELNKLLEVVPLKTDFCATGPIDCDGECGDCEENKEIDIYPCFQNTVNFVKLMHSLLLGRFPNPALNIPASQFSVALRLLSATLYFCGILLFLRQVFLFQQELFCLLF